MICHDLRRAVKPVQCLAVAALLLSVVVSSPAGAEEPAKQPLKDILLEKGVINEADAARVQELPVVVDYGNKGLTFTTRDGCYKLAISLRIQFLHTVDHVRNSDSLALTGGLQNDSSFRVRRAKLAFAGNALTNGLTYKVQLDLVGGVVLNDAYLNWAPVAWAQLQAGQYKLPFNRQQINSTAALQLVDRAITDGAFSPARDIGVTLHGAPAGGLIEYAAGAYNGNGANTTKNDNNGHMFLGRIVLYPLGPFNYYSESDYEITPSPKVGVGFAYLLDTRALRALDGDTLVNDLADIKTGTVDLMVKFHGVSLLAELFQRVTNPRDTDIVANVVARSYGVNLQGGVFVIPQRVELVGRWAKVDPSQRVVQNSISEGGGGINIYFAGHPLKLQIDYLHVRTEGTGGMAVVEKDQVRTQLQAAF